MNNIYGKITITEIKLLWIKSNILSRFDKKFPRLICYIIVYIITEKHFQRFFYCWKQLENTTSSLPCSSSKDFCFVFSIIFKSSTIERELEFGEQLSRTFLMSDFFLTFFELTWTKSLSFILCYSPNLRSSNMTITFVCNKLSTSAPPPHIQTETISNNFDKSFNIFGFVSVFEYKLTRNGAIGRSRRFSMHPIERGRRRGEQQAIGFN